MITEKVNLYIKNSNYTTDYNFYNYNKFKTYRIIPITYRSSTIFLDGLYFELPENTRLLEIKKSSGTMIYNLKLSIPKTNTDIMELFHCINNYNNEFFETNKEKFSYRLVKSNKKQLSDRFTTNIDNNFQLPVKNPLIKNYNYCKFYDETETDIIINVKIKYNYLSKIFQLFNIIESYKSNKIISKLINEMYNEYFEIKESELIYDFSSINLQIKFWIKANNFVGNERNEVINMDWYICDYKLNN